MKKLALLTAALGVTLMSSGCVTTGSTGSDKVVKVDNTTSFAANTDTSAPKRGKDKGLISGLFGDSGMGSGDEKAEAANDKVIAAAVLNAMGGGKPGEKLHWTAPETNARGYIVVGAPNGKDATGAACRPYTVAVTVKDGANVFNRTVCGQDDTVLGPLKEIAGEAFKAPAPEKVKPGKKALAKPAAK